MLVDNKRNEVANMKEMFKNKYKAFMKNVSERDWKFYKGCAEQYRQTVEEVIFNNCITIFRNEIKDYTITYEPIEKGYVKKITSWKSGSQTKFKLTKKGMRWLAESEV
jgi:hypothetical protein